MMPEEIMKTIVVMSGLMMTGLVEARECNSGTTKCYEVYTEQKCFMRALAACRRGDGDLATVRNPAQAVAFLNALREKDCLEEDVWIGASCENKCGKGKKKAWYWITDGAKFSEGAITWGPDEPNDNYGWERVLVTKNLVGDDREYLQEYAFACEYCASEEEINSANCVGNE